MWLQYQQSNLTELFQAALVKLCLENVPFTGNLELDGLFCISCGDISKQIVVKIHKVIQPTLTNQSRSRSILKINQVSVDSDAVRLKDLSLPVEVKLRRQKVEENTVCRSEHSTDFSNGATDSNVAGRTDDGITIIENKTFLELPNSTMNPTSATPKAPLPTVLGINLSNNPSVIAESLVSSEISSVKEEVLEGGLSSGEDDSVNELFLVQDSMCGQTHKDMKCKLCQMNSSDLNELEAHMREIHGRFLCRQCLTTFSLSCNLRRHMKLHTGVRPHVCDACQSSFSRSTDLKIHMRKHSAGRDNFTCSVCLSVFNNSYLLSLHKVKVHGDAEELVSCNQCEKQFSSESQLKLHKRTHRDLSAGDAGGCHDAQMFNVEAEEDAASFEDGSSSSDAWPSVNVVQRTSKIMPPDESLEEMETDLKPNLPFDCKSNRTCNGNAERGLADVRKTISSSYLETVKEFAPLFSISDSDVRSSNCFQPKYPDDSALISSPEQRQQSHSVPTSSKNKRKGMPVKHVKCSESGMYEETAEEELLSDEGLVVDDSVPFSNETINNENIPLCDDFICEDLTYCKHPVVSSSSATRKGVSDSKIADTKPDLEEQMFRDSSQTVCLNNNDAERRVFTCRHGGCSTSWFGFGAYETHYVSAHCRYPCELCDQSFTSRNNRRRHANGHGNVKKHSCDRCDKLFARPDIVKEHRITHTRSYQSGQCCKCHFSCAKKTMLLSHLKRCLAADDIDSDIGK